MRLHCFSPFVILVTFLVEASLGVWALIRYRRTRFGRLAVVLLFLLALYQFAELMICRGAPADFWARVGLAATAFLPIIALDFVSILSGKKRSTATVGYAIAATFILVIVSTPNLLAGSVCTGKFVATYSNSPTFELVYNMYYVAALFTGVGLTIQAMREKTANRLALQWMLIGYAAFMIPTFSLYLAVVALRDGVGSILCGFAVLVALILSGKILPLVHRKN